jgi:hypothetical protein
MCMAQLAIVKNERHSERNLPTSFQWLPEGSLDREGKVGKQRNGEPGHDSALES